MNEASVYANARAARARLGHDLDRDPHDAGAEAGLREFDQIIAFYPPGPERLRRIATWTDHHMDPGVARDLPTDRRQA